MLYCNGEKLEQLYYQGKPITSIYKGGNCIYPAEADTIITSWLMMKLKQFGDELLNTVTAIRRSYIAPTSDIYTVEVSKPQESKYPIYMWISDGVLYWYSIAAKVYTDTEFSLCGGWYAWSGYEYTRLPNCTDISGIGEWDTSRTSTIEGLFYGCSSLSDISPTLNWDLSKVRMMYSVFAECSSALDISTMYKWDIPDFGIYASNAFTDVFANSGIVKFDFSRLQLSRTADFSVAGAFSGCGDLLMCDLGYNIFSIGRNTFYNCRKLYTLICRNVSRTVSVGGLGYDPFTGATTLRSSRGTVYVPQSKLDNYRNDILWSRLLWNYGCQLLPLEGSPYEHPGTI